jgi:hypothetical protein
MVEVADRFAIEIGNEDQVSGVREHRCPAFHRRIDVHDPERG